MYSKDRYGYRYLGEGVRISNDTRVTRLNNNDLIIGSPGSSKTGSIVYPQLKSLEDSSLVVCDTKGRLSGLMSRELKKRGFKVKTLDFVNPEKSCLYNPLDYIRKAGPGAYKDQDIAKLAAALMPSGMSKEEPFWELTARSMLEFFIAYTLYALPEEDHNMYTVSRLFLAFQKAHGEAAFKPWLTEHPDSFAAKRYSQIKGWQHADKMMSSLNAFVALALKPFDYEEYRFVFDPYYSKDKSRNRRRPGLDLGGIGREKTVLFLNVSDNDHSFDAIVNIFYTQILQTLLSEADRHDDGMLEVPVRIMMDDFASSARIPDFDKIISVVRSRDIWITMCIQSYSQLRTLYSDSQATTIENNADHHIYLGCSDLSSANYIGTRALKTPEVILCMDRDKEYVLEAGKPVSLVNKIPSYSFECNDERSDEDVQM
ncbi:MAG: type IV secretory system conjugative DNA transfer family protein [Lachnospiraceae bacterium]|nr:type IV secretory system conjugative DNA transfer family protein [Lachnospiraceae bacterium]